MNYSTRFKRSIISAILLLGVTSLFLATRSSLFYRNMTYVGNMAEYRILFILWGIVQSIFFTCMAYFIISRYAQGKTCKRLWSFTFLDFLLNVIAYLLPYQHPGGDFISQMHVFLSFNSSALAILILLYIMKLIFTQNYTVFIKVKNQMSILLILIFFLAMLLGDFTGIMEIVFLNGISIILYTMLFS